MRKEKLPEQKSYPRASDKNEILSWHISDLEASLKRNFEQGMKEHIVPPFL